MITVKKDNHTVTLTKGAYEQLYKPLGYIPVTIIDTTVVDELKEGTKPTIKTTPVKKSTPRPKSVKGDGIK